MAAITSHWLDRAAIDTGGIIWRSDPACPNLVARLSNSKKLGRKVGWYFRQRGKSAFKLADYPATTLAEARRLCDSVRANNGAAAKEEKAPATVSEHLDDFIAFKTRRGISASTLKKYIAEAKHLNSHLGRQMPDDLSRGAAVDLFDTIKSNRGHRAAGLFHAFARHYWNYLIDRDLATRNPWARSSVMSMEGRSNIAERFLSDDELAQLVNHLDSSREGAATALLLATGLRGNEVLGLRWAEITGSTLVIPAERMKYKKAAHTVYLSPFAMEALGHLRVRGQPRFVFPVSGVREHLYPERLKPYLRKSGIEALTSKVLRATVATTLQQLGCPADVRERMRHHHSHIDRLTRSYEKHSYADEQRHWWERLGAHLEGLRA